MSGFPKATSTRLPSALPKVVTDAVEISPMTAIAADKISMANIRADFTSIEDAGKLIETILTSQEVYATSVNMSRLPDGRFRATVMRKNGDWYRVAGLSMIAVLKEMAQVCERGK